MLNADLIKKAEKRVKDWQELKKAGFICLDGDFFPSVHYPPITTYPAIREEELFSGYKNPEDGLFVVYAHIPFCKQQCLFCHYPNKLGDLPEEKDYYLSMLEKEMDIYMRRLGLDKIKVRSILVGGGTPTYLTPVQLERFLKFFTARLDLSSCTQFNYDVDPSTLLGPDGRQRLKILRAYGVNRLTIGCQSLDDRILKLMNRHHNAADVIKSIQQAREFGFQLNIEFIFGYPGETIESWVKTMQRAISLKTEEIQNYRLKIIPYGDHCGAIEKMFAKHKVEFPPVEKIIMMKEFSIRILEQNGYHQNLTRVFTKKPQYYSHYADDQCCGLFDQIGFGLTAFSSLRDRFGLNTQNFQEYYSMIEQGKLPVNRGLVRNLDDQLRWHIILPLKNRKVFKKYYQARTGVSIEEVFTSKIERLKDFGLLYEDDKVIMLTPLGRFFADEVCQQFYHPDYMPFTKAAFADGILNPYNDWQPFDSCKEEFTAQISTQPQKLLR